MVKNNRFLSLGKKNDYFYILGVSGGPDSMFMMDKMRRLKYNFAAVHVNYNKRESSHSDEKIVFNYCRKFKIIFFSFSVKIYERKENFQSLARKIRYKYFFKIADEIAAKGNKIGGIAIAHHLEDLLETYFFQKQRSSLVNFWGLPFKSLQTKYWIIRPILNFPKEAILNYLSEGKIEYAIDESNYSDIYRRNIIRKEIFSLSWTQKISIRNEVLERNKKLSLIIRDFREKIKAIIGKDFIKLNEIWFKSSNEIQNRLIYYLINSFSNGSFCSSKKNIVTEIRKQLNSNKKRIYIPIGEGFEMKKSNNIVFISKKL